MRRLPVYIVVDTSESMFGEPIDQINRSLDLMLASLHRNPYALETAWLSLITFDSIARALVPLTDISEFKLPTLNARPGTALGTALDLLRVQIAKEVEPATETEKGDWRPIVFLLTDGQPTDSWRPALEKLRAQRPKPANIYAIACGSAVDFDVLKEIADVTFRASEATPDMLSKLFIWMSSAIQSVSKNASQNGLSADDLKTPEGIEIVGDEYPDPPEDPPQLFFHGVCATTRKPYLMRLKYLPYGDGGVYLPDASFPVPDDFFIDGGYTPPEISSDRIVAMPPCPHCSNEDWCSCPRCGTGFCFNHEKSHEQGFVVCPECEARLFERPEDEEGEPFSMRPSAG